MRPVAGPGELFDLTGTRAAVIGGVDAPGMNSSTPFAELGDEEWDRLLDVNLTSVFRTCQVLAPQMTQRPQGASIINISSASSDGGFSAMTI